MRPASSIRKPGMIESNGPATNGGLKVQLGRKGEKLTLSSDDLIIEYCERLMAALK
jgi:hypothetical protein